MAETILVEITIEGKKSTITITPKSCEIEASLDFNKLSSIASILRDEAISQMTKRSNYQSLFDSVSNEII
jgi:hypothetical protein